MRISEIKKIYNSEIINCQINLNQRKQLRKCIELFDKVCKSLNDKDMELVHNYIESLKQSYEYDNELTFIKAFKVGLNIGLEAKN